MPIFQGPDGRIGESVSRKKILLAGLRAALARQGYDNPILHAEIRTLWKEIESLEGISWEQHPPEVVRPNITPQQTLQLALLALKERGWSRKERVDDKGRINVAAAFSLAVTEDITIVPVDAFYDIFQNNIVGAMKAFRSFEEYVGMDAESFCAQESTKEKDIIEALEQLIKGRVNGKR